MYPQIKTVSNAVSVADATAATTTFTDITIDPGYECYGLAYQEDADGGLATTQVEVKDSQGQVIIAQDHKNIILMGSAAVEPNKRFFMLEEPLKKSAGSLVIRCSIITQATTTAALAGRFILYLRESKGNC